MDMEDNKLRVFRDSVAIITGAASGLGQALAEALARKGAEVVLADLQVDRAEEIACGIRAQGGRARAAGIDVSDFRAVEALVQETFRSAGRLDFLFNNAGIVVGGEARYYQLEDWDRVLDVNLRGVVHGVHAVYPLMLHQGFGHIVNTASIAGLIPMAGLLSYSASKHAVVGLSTSLRLEAAQGGVNVSVLCPGAVETPIVGGGKFGKVLHPPPPEVQRRLWERGRPITPVRFAQVALAAVAKNQAVIVIPWWWKIAWWCYRLSPSLGLALARRQFLSSKRIVDEARSRRG
jgi:NAD(P)-dependent dehydrogenase (short-subunit alcohol dehydrogenase family)